MEFREYQERRICLLNSVRFNRGPVLFASIQAVIFKALAEVQIIEQCVIVKLSLAGKHKTAQPYA